MPDEDYDADMPALIPIPDDEDYSEMPALQEPALQEPALQEPALQEPALQEPALQEPALQEPALQEPALQEPALQEEDYSDMPVLLPSPTKWIHPYIFHQYRSLFTPIDDLPSIDDLPPLISDSSEAESSDASGDSGDYVGSGEE